MELIFQRMMLRLICSCLVEVKLRKMLDLVARQSYWTVAKSYRWSGARMSAPPAHADGLASAVKTKIYNQINTLEGCKFGDKCRFAHSEMELGRPGPQVTNILEARAM
ncbi:hypothetical protein POM88_032014 [Heracleum sosnowskyi]|uniref:C3H1-type domain-containing protein n=1 Tax=Heracleum sosnowskyi TaxID=360622 RepID=A0AAD8HZT1_9APIA|nr:hypothetical protein POM88_032014 [Heracleum sosnowskyi]